MGLDKKLYPVPDSSIDTTLIWLLFVSESPLFLTTVTSAFVDVLQSLGTAIYSVESNLTISAGGTVNKYFQR